MKKKPRPTRKTAYSPLERLEQAIREGSHVSKPAPETMPATGWPKSSNHQSERYGVPADPVFVPPWSAIFDPAEGDRLTWEFILEMPQIQAAVPRAIARRYDTSDVLFHLQNTRAVTWGGFPFAVASLTWSGATEPEMFRLVGYFECWSHWEVDGMQSDAASMLKRPAGE